MINSFIESQPDIEAVIEKVDDGVSGIIFDRKAFKEMMEYPASIVRDIFRMKIDGMSALKIAETLNGFGVLSPLAYKRGQDLPHPTGGFADSSDAKWSATAIFRILNDETYTGSLIQGRKGTPNYKIREVEDKPESEWARTEDAQEAIVTKLDFALAQRLMKLDTRSAPGGESVYLFSGILICGCCGDRMTRKINRYKGREYYYYYCPTGKKHNCRDASMLKESDLTDCVLESIKAHIAIVASLEAVLTSGDRQKAAQALAKQYQDQIEENKRQLVNIIGFKTSLYENMVNGLIDKSDYKSYKAKYSTDEILLWDAISALEIKRNNALSGKAERLRWLEHFRQFEGLNELDRRTVFSLVKAFELSARPSWKSLSAIRWNTIRQSAF